MARRVLIMAGGTGGHIYPALAVAEDLRARGLSLYWLGTTHGLEARLVPAAGIELLTIAIAGLRRRGVLRWLVAPWRIAYAIAQSVVIMLRLRPGVVLGMGGFASGPGGIAAWLCRRPLVIHEQNAIAGLTNRILRHFAATVLEAFPDSFGPGRATAQTGNPVRRAIAALPPPKDRGVARRDPFRILVFGGSHGARILNEVVPLALGRLAAAHRISVRHQTGDADVAAVVSRYRQVSLDADVSGYIDDMAAAYGDADLIISRAGAITIAEIAAAGVASLLVPYPFAVDDHQTANARYLATREAALVLRQAELTVDGLATRLDALLGDRDRILRMAQHARAAALPEATNAVARYCAEYVNG